jgi:hypothetical protein
MSWSPVPWLLIQLQRVESEGLHRKEGRRKHLEGLRLLHEKQNWSCLLGSFYEFSPCWQRGTISHELNLGQPPRLMSTEATTQPGHSAFGCICFVLLLDTFGRTAFPILKTHLIVSVLHLKQGWIISQSRRGYVNQNPLKGSSGWEEGFFDCCRKIEKTQML